MPSRLPFTNSNCSEMKDTQSEEFKYHYQRSKLKVKQWEDDFKARNGRIPTKVDIKASSPKVRHYYKIYWKLKTMLLEETILGNSNPVEMNTFSKCKSDSVLKEHTNIIDKSFESNKNSQGLVKKNMKENDISQDGSNVTSQLKTWGQHLNKKISYILDNDKCSLNILNTSVSEKLFEGSKFKKRNPRKSLKREKNVSTTEINNSLPSTPLQSNMSLTSLDTLSSYDSSQTDLSPCPDTQNELGEECSVESNCSPKIKALIMSKTELSPLFAKFDKCRVVSDNSKIQNHPISLVQKIANDQSKDGQTCRTLNPGWIERCNENVEKHNEKLSSDSGFESLNSTVIGSSPEAGGREENQVVVESDDDIIAGSDNELDRSKSNFLPVKRKSEDASPSFKTSASPEASEAELPVKKIKLDPYVFPAGTSAKKSATETKEARLKKKINQKTLNENYVRINIKKKVFVRGKKNFNYAKYKKQQWKNLKKNLEADENCGVVKCYKCGEAGHFARYCQKTMKDIPDVNDVEEDEDIQLPTLEEAEAMAREKAAPKKDNLGALINQPEAPAEEPRDIVGPYYELREDGTLIDTPEEVHEALYKFGHANFRPGQEQAIMRILSGLSTLVTINTGGGKSLCYQLPAYLYAMKSKCITLVVSPLVSLMEDQVSGSSSFFKLGCLHASQTQKQRENVIQDLKNGKLFALLVSPESLTLFDNCSVLGKVLKFLPPIAFACIDEAHCVSQWSHNFRPSYLLLTRILREKMGVKTILGLTATATKSTTISITKELGITDVENGVIKGIPIPNNLCLSISRDENKDKALLELLRGPRFKDANSILIYCKRRDECERVAVLIRTVFSSRSEVLANDDKELPWNAESYHAGMSSARRKQIQKAFMKGNLRVVVATVAFGMGINKRDIRGVIHYNMPKDFESYVQEVGRAGRDGMLAQCHLFLDTNGKDLCELRRHIYSNTVDRHVLRKLLQRVFVDCKCKGSGKSCPSHEVAFDCQETVQTLDIPEENIYTLLFYLEMHPKKLVKVTNLGYMNCKIQSYHGLKAINDAAKTCPPLAVACARDPALANNKTSPFTFNVIELANYMSWESGGVKNQLKNVEWSQGKDGGWKRSGINVEFSGLGFRLYSRGDMSPEELDEALEYLIQRVENQEKRESNQLQIIYSTLSHLSAVSYKDCLESHCREKSSDLKNLIRKYFETEDISDQVPMKKLEVRDFDEDEVASDVRALICSYRDNNFNGRAVARIFHGIQSPNYPATTWFKCRLWRRHIDKDFNKICRIATKEILRYK